MKTKTKTFPKRQQREERQQHTSHNTKWIHTRRVGVGHGIRDHIPRNAVPNRFLFLDDTFALVEIHVVLVLLLFLIGFVVEG